MTVELKHVYGNVYDAFWEKGWLNWSRFLYKRGEIIHIKGQKMTEEQKKFLSSVVPSVQIQE